MGYLLDVREKVLSRASQLARDLAAVPHGLAPRVVHNHCEI